MRSHSLTVPNWNETFDVVFEFDRSNRCDSWDQCAPKFFQEYEMALTRMRAHDSYALQWSASLFRYFQSDKERSSFAGIKGNQRKRLSRSLTQTLCWQSDNIYMWKRRKVYGKFLSNVMLISWTGTNTKRKQTFFVCVKNYAFNINLSVIIGTETDVM